MILEFLEQSGCWERHLQRKINNWLFPEDRRNPGNEELLLARQKDHQERQEFLELFHQIVIDALNLQPNVPSELVLQLKERMEKLSILGHSIGGSLARELTSIEKLQQVIMRTVQQSIGDDPLAKVELEKEAAAFELHQSLLKFPMVALLLRPESPILDDELVPTLLSEDVESLSAVLCLFDEEQLSKLRLEAAELLSELTRCGKHLPDAV